MVIGAVIPRVLLFRHDAAPQGRKYSCVLTSGGKERSIILERGRKAQGLLRHGGTGIGRMWHEP
jgi:hypothetical protein